MKEFSQFNIPSKEIKEIGDNDTLKMEVESLKNCLRGIVYMAESGLYIKNEIAFVRCIAEAKELCMR